MRMTGLAAAFALIVSALPAGAANWLEMNTYMIGPRYDGVVPACEYGLGVIASRFATKEGRFWNSDLQILSFEKVRQVAFRPWADNTIPRRFCTATALVSDGKKRQVERNTRTAYQGVIAGVSRVKAYKQAVVSNQTALEASEVGLEVGARTAVDVLNAQRDYSKSRYDYLTSILKLKQSAGQLTVKDLNEIDALLGAQQGSAVARKPAN